MACFNKILGPNGLTRCMDCPNMAWVGMAVWTNNIHLWSLFGRTLKGSPCFDVFDICCFVCYAPCFIEKSHANIGVLHIIWRHRPSLMAKISMAWVRDRVFQIMSDTIRYKILKHRSTLSTRECGRHMHIMSFVHQQNVMSNEKPC